MAWVLGSYGFNLAILGKWGSKFMSKLNLILWCQEFSKLDTFQMWILWTQGLITIRPIVGVAYEIPEFC